MKPEPYGEIILRASSANAILLPLCDYWLRLTTIVKTTSYILKKYAKCPPSLILHLHPTHFRFEQQDGSFPYNSEMKVIIEHLRAGTVPHEIIEELLHGGVKFYEGIYHPEFIDL
jgi:transcription factor SPT20